jgi:hypothetical protein
MVFFIRSAQLDRQMPLDNEVGNNPPKYEHMNLNELGTFQVSTVVV